MLRCIKYCAMGLIVTGLLLVAYVGPSLAAVEAIQKYEVTEWSNEIYYLACLSGKFGLGGSYDDITVKITAVDEYTLYINGTEVGSDDDWSDIETYENIYIGDQKVYIAVKVTNKGLGNGNGLIVDIQAGQDQFGSSTTVRESQEIAGSLTDIPVAWWCFDKITKEALIEAGTFTEDDWYLLAEDKDGLTILNDKNIISQMRRPFEGKIAIDETDFVAGKPIAGYLFSDVDVSYVDEITGAKGLALRRIEGENIAHLKPSQFFKLTDGDLVDGYYYTAIELNDTQYVDLKRLYQVNQMTIYTGWDKPEHYWRYSFRGYAVEISLDQFRWEEVGVIHNIGEEDEDGNINEGGFDNYTVTFPLEWARYVRYNATELRVDAPKVGEIMIYGTGYVLEGSYESEEWIDLGSPDAVKNFKQIMWEGEVPDGTSMTIQTMTKNGVDGAPSTWSDKMGTAQIGAVSDSFLVSSPEPATHIKYKVNFKTQDPNKTPILEKLTLEYSVDNQPVTYADGYILPMSVAMGDDAEFVYSVAYNLAPGQNIKEVQIAVPGTAVLNYVRSSDMGGNVSGVSTTMSDDLENLVVTFATPITDTNAAVADTLNISFNAKLYKSSHTFEAYLFGISGGILNDQAGGINVWESTQSPNTVLASTVAKKILDNVKAIPKVFTPNGDNKNDFTVIEFTLAKVETNVKINIYNTAGRLISTITDEFKTASDYSVGNSVANTAIARGLPGFWDGTDADGDLVPPGIYVYQVVVEADQGDEIEDGTVVVAY